MRPEIEQLLQTIHGQLVEFWVPWLCTTGAIAVGSAWFVGRASAQEPPVSPEQASRRVEARKWSMGAGIGLSLLAVMIAGYVAGAAQSSASC